MADPGRAVTVLAAVLAALCAASGGGPSGAGQPGALPGPLTDVPGNPSRGRQIVRDQGAASCLICHAMPIPEEPDHGNVGPPLHGIGARYSAAELRQRLVDPKALNPDTVMPSYFSTEGLYRVLDRHADRPIYTAQQVEDVVAYLVSLRDGRP